MNCPKCIDKVMEPLEIEGVEFDFCCQDGGCLGLWCDKGELAFYTVSIKYLPFKSAHASAKKTELKCPKCADEILYEIQYQKDPVLHVDLCQKCSGIFVDKGELINIKKSVARILLKERMKFLQDGFEKKGFKFFG